MEARRCASGCPSSALLDPKIVWPAIGSAFAKLDPRTLIKNPVMFVVEVVAALTTVIFLRDLVAGGEQSRLRRSRSSSGSGSPCCSPISPRRSPRAAARRRPTRSGGRAPRRRRSCSPAPTRTSYKTRARHQPQGRRRRAGRGRRHHPLRRRGDRGHRLGQRGGDHRRIGAGHPRVRRRPLGGHRRHAGALRLDQGADHRGAGLDLPRPHDPAGRGRRAAEDAERDRAQHPARRPDDHLRLRDGDDPELRRLCRRRDLGRRAGRAVRHADPDDHRRAALGDRHRRHGPAGALQRARHVGPRGRGGGRRRHAAPRQDRHDHARQPPGDASSSRCAASPSRSSPTRRRWPRSPTRRRRAARSSCSPRRSTASAAASWPSSRRASSRSRRRPG